MDIIVFFSFGAAFKKGSRSNSSGMILNSDSITCYSHDLNNALSHNHTGTATLSLGGMRQEDANVTCRSSRYVSACHKPRVLSLAEL